MRGFVFKGILFVISLVFVLVLIKKTVPYYWGNPEMSKKFNYLQNSKQHYNTFFIGSSRILRHIDPIIFDEITGLKSYNLGCGGMQYLETHYLLDNFTKQFSDTADIRFFIKGMRPNSINERNYHKVRSKYFMDFKRLRMALIHFGKQKNFQQIWFYLTSYIENQLAIGEVQDIISYHFSKEPKLHNLYKRQQGYLTLEQMVDTFGVQGIIDRQTKYQNQLKNKTARTLKYKYNLDELEINQLEKERLGINVRSEKMVFYNISMVRLTPDLYFDKGHFNTKGAQLYTKKLANVYNETVVEKNN